MIFGYATIKSEQLDMLILLNKLKKLRSERFICGNAAEIADRRGERIFKYSAPLIEVESIDHIPLDAPTNGTTNGRALVEIKSGNADLNSNQKIVYAQAAAGDATGRGGNEANAGFNSQTAPRSVIILFDTKS